MPRILLIEDETAIADTVLYALSTEGFEAQHVTLGSAGLQALHATPFDLVVLDVGLPDASGFEICRQLRTYSDVPVIFLTARAGEIDRVVGLEIGADDYLTKPFSPRELVARIRVILRRTARQGSGVGEQAAPNLFHVDEEKARISHGQQPLDLTRYEFLLFKTLLAQPERVFSREQLMQQVWTAPDHSLERTVDTHIKTLRAKIKASGAPDPIRTHRGLGYSCSLKP